MRDDIRPGGTFPDYTLPDHTGAPRSLSFLQGEDPLVLTLHRGAFCPKDRQQLRGLVPFHDECVVGVTRLVSVTTDDSLMELTELRHGVGAHWPFLYDADRTIADDLGIHEYTDPEHRPMVPYTFVLAPGLRVHSVYNGYWYWGRPGVDELRRDLREVTRQLRPDWQIDTAEARARWEAGEGDAFFPYGRSNEEVVARASDAFGLLDGGGGPS